MARRSAAALGLVSVVPLLGKPFDPGLCMSASGGSEVESCERKAGDRGRG